MRLPRRALRRVARLLVAVLLLGANAGVEGLGRLFSTVQEREQLDAMRRRAERGLPSTSEPQAEQVPVSARLRVNGLVVREHGPDSVWINGERVNRDGQTHEGIRVHGESGGRVRVVLPHDAGAVRLKAGQQVDLSTGTVRDAYESDAVAASDSEPLSGDGAGESGR